MVLCMGTYNRRILCRTRSWDVNGLVCEGLFIEGFLRMRFRAHIRKILFSGGGGGYYRNFTVSHFRQAQQLITLVGSRALSFYRGLRGSASSLITAAVISSSSHI